MTVVEVLGLTVRVAVVRPRVRLRDESKDSVVLSESGLDRELDSVQVTVAESVGVYPGVMVAVRATVWLVPLSDNDCVDEETTVRVSDSEKDSDEETVLLDVVLGSKLSDGLLIESAVLVEELDSD